MTQLRILLTGSSGYLGHAVRRHLEREGHALTLLGRTLPQDTLHRLIPADLRDSQDLRRALDDLDVDVVCHLAALTKARESVEQPLPYWETNVSGTINLLSAIRPGTAVVMTSTAAVYTGDAEGALDETVATDPANPYAASKLAAEQVLTSWADATDSAATIIRCFNIAGAVDGVGDTEPSRIIPAMFRALRGQIPAFTVNGDGSTIRDYTHVADVAAGIALAVQAKGTALYNLGTGEGLSIAQLIDAVQEITAQELPIQHADPKQEAQRLVADSRRLRAALSWVPYRSTAKRIVIDAWDAWEAA